MVDKPRKVGTYAGIALVAGVIVLIANLFLQFYLLSSHQIEWSKHRDKEYLAIQHRARHAPQGVVLLVESRSDITKALTQHEIVPMHGYPYWEPEWKAHKISENDYIVMAQIGFNSGSEWYLELFSSDNHWICMSPYFPDNPELSNVQWKNLWNAERLTGDTVTDLFPIKADSI